MYKEDEPDSGDVVVVYKYPLDPAMEYRLVVVALAWKMPKFT